jgi:hypothetical protein
VFIISPGEETTKWNERNAVLGLEDALHDAPHQSCNAMSIGNCGAGCYASVCPSSMKQQQATTIHGEGCRYNFGNEEAGPGQLEIDGMLEVS